MREWTEAQLTAITASGCDILVSAAAGSGKTAALTERLIRKLTDVNAPAELSRMLIVTFTRPAAAELKQRIGKALSDAIEAEPHRRDLVRQSLNLAGAHIGTIHSFCLSLIRSNFAALGLDPAVRTADENEALTVALSVMDRLLADRYAQSEKNDLTDEERSRCDGFIRLTDTFVTDRDDGLAAFMYGIYVQTRNFVRCEAVISDSADALLSGAETDFFSTVWGEEIRNGISGELLYYEKIYSEAVRYFASDEALEKKYGAAFATDLTFIRELTDALGAGYSRAAGVVRSYNKRSVGKTSVPDDENIIFYKSARSDFDGFRKSLCKKLALPQSRISEIMKSASELCNALYGLISEFSERYREEKSRRGIIDFSDIEHLALELLTDENGLPTDIARQTASQFDEIYIDEYQDINPVQDMIFRSIARGNRFMVGDIKQSIYGFRGAAPEIFSEYRSAFPKYGFDAEKTADKNGTAADAAGDRDTGVHASGSMADSRNACNGFGSERSAGGRTVYLSHNFRCDRPIIDFTNAVFSAVMRAECGSSIDYGDDDRLVFAKKTDGTEKCVPVCVAVISPVPEQESQNAEPQTVVGKSAAPDMQTSSLKASLTDTRGKPDSVTEDASENAEGASGRFHVPAAADAEAEFVASESARLIASGKYSPGDIRILLRSGVGNTDRFARAFARHGVPFESCRAIGFFERPHVLLALSLLRCIDNPTRDIPLAAVLCSPLCGFTPEELIAVKNNIPPDLCNPSQELNESEKPRISLLDCLRGYTEEYGFEKGSRFLLQLERLRRMAAAVPSDRLIWQLYGETPLLCCGNDSDGFDAEARRSDLLKLYDYARGFERGGFRGLSAFLSSVDSLIKRDPHFDFRKDAPTESGSVEIMTIHKSKGLEFPVCFLCGASKRFNKADAGDLLMIDKKLGICSKFRDKNGFLRYDTPMRAAAEQRENDRIIDEEMRLLYVALTRARERLYVTAGESRPDALIADAAYCAGYPSPYSAAKNASYMKWILSSAVTACGGFPRDVFQTDRSCTLYSDSACRIVSARYRTECGRVVFCGDPFADLRTEMNGSYGTADETESISKASDIRSAPEISEQRQGTDENPACILADGQNYSDLSGSDGFRELLRQRLTRTYRYGYGARLPAKLSVSAIHPGILDEDPAPSPADAERYAEMLSETVGAGYPYQDNSYAPIGADIPDGCIPTYENSIGKEKSHGEPLKNDASAETGNGSGDAPVLRGLKRPRFLEGTEHIADGAERGTATHVFLQFCNWDRVCSAGIGSERERMVENGFMTSAMAELISVPMLRSFFGSRMFSELREAKRVWRELRFNVLLPASDFTENSERKLLLSGEKLLVQGIIDCLYVTSDGKLRLLDYKTDHLPRGQDAAEILKARYKNQLESYKKAAALITGMPLDRCIIYALSCGLEIDV